MKKNRVIGITGGIATGKSAVLHELKRLGIPVISSDTLAHECLLHGHPAYRNVVRHFGKALLGAGHQINRKMLGKIVFSSQKERKWLEKCIHPHVIRQLKSFIRKHRGLTALDIPLLFEARLENLVDVTVVVGCSETLQLKRLKSRNGMKRAEALQRIHSQMSLSAKKKRADYVIENNGTLNKLRNEVKHFLAALRRKP